MPGPYHFEGRKTGCIILFHGSNLLSHPRADTKEKKNILTNTSTCHSFGTSRVALRSIYKYIYIQYFSKPGDTFLSGHRLVLPRLASPGLALPCLVMPCLVLPGFECDAFSSNIKIGIHMVGLFQCVFFFFFFTI